MKLNDLYRHYSQCHPDDIKELNEQHALYEGLIKSVNPKQMAQLIHNLHTAGKVSYDRKYDSRVLDVTFKVPVDVTQLELIFERTRVAGWFFATANINARPTSKDPDTFTTIDSLLLMLPRLSKNTRVQIVFEAKYGYDVTEDIIESYEHLYHATPTANVAKIQRGGLSPRTHSKLANHPERIYFAKNIDDVKSYLIPQFRELTNVNDWTILQVDISAFNQLGVRLFDDPAFPDGVYTLSNVSPSFIKVVEQ